MIEATRIDDLRVDQSYFTFQNDRWSPVNVSKTGPPNGSNTPFKFSIFSWNIDFQRGYSEIRMKAALNHVYSLVKGQTIPSFIMFEEMEECDLDLIQDEEWIRKDYNVTDISNQFWQRPGYYGTCILIPKALPIRAVFRVRYDNSEMQRDGLFVDVSLPENKTLRVCATHLESFVARPPKRPGQLATAAKFLHQADIGILAGDLNAIEPFDQTLHQQNNLKDAYLERGGQEGEEAGMTWGQMAFKWQRERYGLTRMDKVLYCGRAELLDFGTFGMDVEVEDEADRQEMLLKLGGLEKAWVTDHLGIRADFSVRLSD